MKNNNFTLIFVFFLISCINNSSKKNSNALELTSENTDLYEIIWIEENYKVGGKSNFKTEKELYISKNSDTLINQIKVFENDRIDINQGKYYDLTLKKTENDIQKGKLKLFTDKHHLDVKNYNKSSINLYILCLTNDGADIKNFEVNNTDLIEFQFECSNDTLMGLIIHKQYKDTIVSGGKEALSVIEHFYLIDNKSKTNNDFIDAFDLMSK